ncbi:hypothetical protein [Leptothoe spongobia]|uniref:Uncharacterized protein n=1 Tax=Leptothoe spongobia TAU-MAC 1115 TaxID=1967444 RepID=A0A947DIA2_9CYAN|nr:hypothetical protein [Leptothoe spongobia]MBT9317521.1 hypothetical protein [Leptothoe spongobia TAU-MAC 1115]
MPSSSRPYQSKVLRFVLKQWQQGLERQDKAWRQLQSTAVWGAQVAIFPIYAIMRSVERARFTFSSGNATQTDQATEPSTAAKGAEPSIAAKGNVTDINHSLTAILSHTQQLLDPQQTAQLIVAPPSNIIHATQSFLSNALAAIEQRLPIRLQRWRGSQAITKRQRGHLTSHKKPGRGGLTTVQPGNIGHSHSADLLQNGTTLASSLKTRRLVLVNPSNETFDIFTPKQQADLKHYINCVMNAYRQSRTIARRQTKKLSVKTILTLGEALLKSLPGKLGNAWPQITPAPQKGSLTRIDHSLSTILSHTQELLAPQQSAQLTIAPTGNITQKNQRDSLTKKAHSTEIDRSSTSDLLQNGTTLASSLQTRKLVLVNPSNETFDIFTPEQQADLKHYINCIMNAYRQSRTIARRQTKQLSVKTVLAISTVFLKSLPGEFNKAWKQIAPGPQQEITLPPIPRDNDPKPLTRVFYPHTVGTVKARRSPNHVKRRTHRLTSKSPDAFEANVNDASYLEHPLESILRWIDRVLTWCEHRWQQWVEGRTNLR